MGQATLAYSIGMWHGNTTKRGHQDPADKPVFYPSIFLASPQGNKKWSFESSRGPFTIQPAGDELMTGSIHARRPMMALTCPFNESEATCIHRHSEAGRGNPYPSGRMDEMAHGS